MKPVRCGCGGETIVLPCFKPNLQRQYIVICLHCQTKTEYKNTEAEAITAWNRAMGADDIPSAVPERKKGEWVKVSGYFTPGGDPVWKCSECGKGMHVYGIEANSYNRDYADGQWVSCPNCGADMRGSEHTAHWFATGTGMRCSACGYKCETTSLPDVCPSCGSRMVTNE